jgi:hypothetical protein
VSRCVSFKLLLFDFVAKGLKFGDFCFYLFLSYSELSLSLGLN